MDAALVTYAEELHTERKARLARMRATPKRTILQITPPTWKGLDEGPHWSSMWMGDLVFGKPRVDPGLVTIAEIQKAVCAHFAMTVTMLNSAARTVAYSHPRQIAMYLCRHLTRHSMTMIARHFGDRDHTTVLHGVRVIERKLLEDAQLAGDVKAIKRSLGVE